ncbi:DUF3313 domain-containing protein [Elioraea sp.]|uniref:DUF3313 domain-containing protein n=1 Tax=Elioraea sp. TaxID=2185103 RepID=UPI0025C23F5C|nr:DUF3313 domain-containing protein [Elioraea sp.]
MPPSGFLGAETYALLRPGAGGETAQFFYVNPDAHLRRYDRIILEPMQFWRPPGMQQTLTAEQRQVAADLFHATLREELAKDFQIVSQPGPTTMVVATAITQLSEGGPPVLSTVSNFVPITRLARRGAAVLTGSDPLVGHVSGEIRITDSVTGEVIGAAVDSRDARAGIAVHTSRWDDVQAIARYWAQLARYRLCRGQERAGCVPPPAGIRG